MPLKSHEEPKQVSKPLLRFFLLSQGKIKVKELITHRLPLEKLKEGINLAESGKAMKVAVLPWE